MVHYSKHSDKSAVRETMQELQRQLDEEILYTAWRHATTLDECPTCGCSSDIQFDNKTTNGNIVQVQDCKACDAILRYRTMILFTQR